MLKQSIRFQSEEVNMQNIIATMQKHINKQFSQDSIPCALSQIPQQSIHKFSEDMKGANEFIGALQTANVACRKILKLAKDLGANSLSQDSQDLQDIIENTAFMGVKLFNTQLSTTLNATSYTFCIDNPMPLLQADSNIQALIAYINEKSQEITQLLLTLSDALVESSTPSTSSENYNFNEFNAKAFSQILKG
ncbi:flagellar FLiS export co-chaperone [Helicobacter cinaedi]|uniref:flagellar FLiS export co-chaperone n=1 Tax=Helicobacter cinaedi TaxID=213 RepID=UPI001F2BFCB9|nr:flagellar FLiS export co-chaperone [Helicobacter cinaedi]